MIISADFYDYETGSLKLTDHMINFCQRFYIALLDHKDYIVLPELCLKASPAIVIAFDKFFAPCDTTANTAPNLRKYRGSSGTSYFFRNLLNHLASGLDRSFNCSEAIEF